MRSTLHKVGGIYIYICVCVYMRKTSWGASAIYSETSLYGQGAASKLAQDVCKLATDDDHRRGVEAGI